MLSLSSIWQRHVLQGMPRSLSRLQASPRSHAKHLPSHAMSFHLVLLLPKNTSAEMGLYTEFKLGADFEATLGNKLLNPNHNRNPV